MQILQTIMSMFNDNDWTKNKFLRMSFEFRKSQDYAKRFRLDIGHFLILEKKTNGMERAIANLKEIGKLLLMSWWKNSMKVDIHCSEVPVSPLDRGLVGWKIYDQNLPLSSRDFISNIYSLSNSAQYMRSSGALVRRIGSTDT